MLMGEVRAEQLMRGLSDSVRESLSSEQESAIREVVRKGEWDRHPVDVRLAIPSPFGRYYATFVAGPERRSGARRQVDRQKHPIMTLTNVAFAAGATLFCGLVSLGVLSLLAGILAP